MNKTARDAAFAGLLLAVGVGSVIFLSVREQKDVPLSATVPVNGDRIAGANWPHMVFCVDGDIYINESGGALVKVFDKSGKPVRCQ